MRCCVGRHHLHYYRLTCAQFAVVELLWSVAFTHRVLGSVELADRAEVVAFNALPGGVSEDAKAHNVRHRRIWRERLVASSMFCG